MIQEQAVDDGSSAEAWHAMRDPDHWKKKLDQKDAADAAEHSFILANPAMPARQEMGKIYMDRMHGNIKLQKDPVVRIVADMCEQIWAGTDFTNPEGFLRSIAALEKAVRGNQ